MSHPVANRVHSFLSDACEVRPSPISERGLFARRPIGDGELVAVWGGIVLTTAEIEAEARHDQRLIARSLCIAEDHYLAWRPTSETDDAELFNHSCEPNLGVDGRIVLIARRPIRAGEELTFDYDTTELLPQPWTCRCGSSRCRGAITGRAWTDATWVEENARYLAPHVAERARRAGTLKDDRPTRARPRGDAAC